MTNTYETQTELKSPLNNLSKNKDLIVFGTRPEIIKLSPIIKNFNAVLLNTGQHLELAEQALHLFKIKPDYNLHLMTECQTPADFIPDAINAINKVIDREQPTRIWVQGDTMSAYVGALVGFLRKIEVIHLEAGLRSGNISEPFPEEMFRKAISQMATIHLCPTMNSLQNLAKEGISDNVFMVGNTIVDALKSMDIPDESPMDEQYVLLTAHRREAQGQPLRNIFEAVKELPIKVVFPCHPNPEIRKLADEVGIKYVEPMDYETLLWYLKHCKFVLTDSGGIQEEAPYFRKPVLILRNVTDRPESIEAGFAELVGWDKEKILHFANNLLNDSEIYNLFSNGINPYGDGNTVKLIKKVIML